MSMRTRIDNAMARLEGVYDSQSWPDEWTETYCAAGHFARRLTDASDARSVETLRVVVEWLEMVAAEAKGKGNGYTS